MKLYRGDKVQNIGDWFLNEGIFIKGANGGNPLTIKKEPITKLIEKHVYPQKDSNGYHQVTDFVSFSESKDIALKYMSNGKHIKEIEFDQDPRFVLFCFEIDKMQLVSEGIYKASYIISFKRSREIISGIKSIEKKIKYTMPLNNSSTTDYEGEKANVILFNLQELKSRIDFDPVVSKRVVIDKEWLILPSDTNRYNSCLGLETRLYPNDNFILNFF